MPLMLLGHLLATHGLLPALAAGSGVPPDLGATVLFAGGFGDSITRVVTNIIAQIRIPMTALLALGIVWGGFQIMTAGGDERKSQAARSTILLSIAGAFLIWFGPDFAAMITTAFGGK